MWRANDNRDVVNERFTNIMWFEVLLLYSVFHVSRVAPVSLTWDIVFFPHTGTTAGGTRPSKSSTAPAACTGTPQTTFPAWRSKRPARTPALHSACRYVKSVIQWPGGRSNEGGRRFIGHFLRAPWWARGEHWLGHPCFKGRQHSMCSNSIV